MAVTTHPAPSAFIACCGVNLIFLPLPLTTHHCLTTSLCILLLQSPQLHYSAQWSSQLNLNELWTHTSAIYHIWCKVLLTKFCMHFIFPMNSTQPTYTLLHSHAHSQNCEKRLLASSYLSAWNQPPSGWIIMKFDTWVFFKNLSRKFKFH